MMELNIQKWQQELDSLARRAGIPSPRLKLGTPRWMPAWWSRKTGGFATFNSIVILDISRNHKTTPMRYLLAHELGHIYHRHSRKFCIAVLLVVALGSGALYLWTAPFVLKQLLMTLFVVLLPFCCDVWIMLREYQADEFAAGLIGVEETMDGLEIMGIITETTNSKERRKRLAHLRRRTEAAELRCSTEGIDI